MNATVRLLQLKIRRYPWRWAADGVGGGGGRRWGGSWESRAEREPNLTAWQSCSLIPRLTRSSPPRSPRPPDYPSLICGAKASSPDVATCEAGIKRSAPSLLLFLEVWSALLGFSISFLLLPLACFSLNSHQRVENKHANSFSATPGDPSSVLRSEMLHHLPLVTAQDR